MAEEHDSSDEEARDAQHTATLELLSRRQRLTERLYEHPYDLVLYLERAVVHSDLAYPDLAASDAYRALLLTDEVANAGFEYHDEARAALRAHLGDAPADAADAADGDAGAQIERLRASASRRCYRILAISLLLCGSLKSAYDFAARGLAAAPGDEELAQAQEYVLGLARRRLKSDEVDVAELPDQGLVRREVYPWNAHEPDRYAADTLERLNAQLAVVAPKCEARVTELPTLGDGPVAAGGGGAVSTNKQLGLFAKEDIAPGETVLDEVSLLTANNRFVNPLCDTCSSELAELGAAEGQVWACEECQETLFCSEACRDLAAATYHAALCERDLESVARDGDARELPNTLYLLLLARALAMASVRGQHPLELAEVKYIWGDFVAPSSNAVPLSARAGPPPVWTLPFSFRASIAGPLHLLEQMDVDVFATLREHDLWVVNTLYAKFRGTASSRASRYDGRPEVAAVHPLWCLANHDCAPNVQWEWGARMRLWARETRVGGEAGGIRRGEEILSHYTDPRLPVRQRREWAQGSLGGFCMCERCRREAAEEAEKGGKEEEEAPSARTVNGA